MEEYYECGVHPNYKKALTLLKKIYDNGTFFNSAIELEHNFNGEVLGKEIEEVINLFTLKVLKKDDKYFKILEDGVTIPISKVIVKYHEGFVEINE